ncbi:MAG: ABC transporter substrate-binding protein, partial [Tropheryma whipplei]|nr:ABC transporter substrate-binding protein [Tropheryma whipplei]
MFGRKLLGALVALSLLTGCFGGKGDSESSSVLSKVETVFGEVTIPRPKGHDLRVVALGRADAEAALAVGIKPVAVLDAFNIGGKGVGPWAEGLFGDVKPTVMSFSTDGLNWEQIKAFKPDVILDVRSKNDEKTYKRLSQIAPTVYGPPGTKSWVLNWRDQQRQVAKALGRIKEGEEAIKKTEKAIKDAQDPLYRGLK